MHTYFLLTLQSTFIVLFGFTVMIPSSLCTACVCLLGSLNGDTVCVCVYKCCVCVRAVAISITSLNLLAAKVSDRFRGSLEGPPN